MRSIVYELGTLVASGASLGNYVELQRWWDENGVIQLEVAGTITAGNIRIMGRAEPTGALVQEYQLAQLDIPTVVAPGLLVTKIPLYPQMRIRLASGAGGGTVTGYLLT